MLTTAAFNALLKTLEEPPPHVILVLATTEPQDVPNTIISRCQRFDFRRISNLAIAIRLENLCIWEEIDADKETLITIAKQSGGSLRDAINMLEQLYVSYGSSLKLNHIRDLLGLAEEEHTLKLTEHILRKETGEGLKLLNSIASGGVDLKQLRAGVVESLRAALLIKSAARDVIEQSTEVLERLTTITDMVETHDLLQALQLFGEPTRKGDEASLLSLELALVQATLENHTKTTSQGSESGANRYSQTQPVQPSVGEFVSPMEPVPPTPPSFSKDNILPKTRDNSATSAQTPIKQQTPAESILEKPHSDSHSEISSTPEILTSKVDKNWNQIVQALSKTKGKRFMIGALMRGSRSHRLDGQSIILNFANKSNMERLKEEIESPHGRIAIREILSQILGSPLEIKVELDEKQYKSESNSNSGHLVMTALRMGARIVNEENTK
jgi:DNA polymerase-3 subunit gamma/tau